jgi:hypothetical protein
LWLACCLFSTALFAQWNGNREPLSQNITPPALPASADFCGEKMPLEYFDVRESLQREMNSICYWHSSMIYTVQLAQRYMDIIEKILKENGVPDDLKYMCVAESNLQNLVSPAKAAGFWQFLSSTAKDYGLEVNAEIDERYHFEKSTQAACKYMKDAYAKFGNWTMAAASYNVGMGHINNQIAVQKTDNYYNLLLNQETGRYIFRAVAYKTIMQNPEKYGFRINAQDFYPLRYRELEVKGTVNWVDLALENDTNYKMLRYFNPWIRDVKLTNRFGKTYKVKIPEKGYRTSVATSAGKEKVENK